MRNFCLTCGKFAPEPGVAYGYSGPVCQCLNPSLGRQLVDALKEANQAQKPDASPREWTLLFKGDGYFEPHVLGAEPSDFPKAGKRTFDVIEKSAYDALKARVAKCEQRFAKADDLANELAAANETIKALRHEMRMQGGAVERETQANARIAELEVAYDCLEEREAKLVAALEEVLASSLYICTHLPIDLSKTAGAKLFSDALREADEALKAHTASAEKGGA